MAKKKRGIPGVSFSWRRALGVSSAKAKISRQLGIPLSRSARQRKAGRAMGCLVPCMITGSGFTAAAVLLAEAVARAVQIH
jgi:hypothetical protein